jgi:predicted aspartyl protease/regulator of sirC expression with transglutaminase-like and TPR domain
MLILASPVAAAAAAACKINKIVDLPATSRYGLPLVTVQIDGKDVQMLADSGAFFSMLSPKAAEAIGLRLRGLPVGMQVGGVGGIDNKIQVGTAKQLSFGGVVGRNMDFLVGSAQVFGGGAEGLLGQNVLRSSDIEYDLANGVIRLWRPEGCNGVTLAYWNQANAASLALDPTSPIDPHLQGTVVVNGVRLKATFDTGASTSLLTRRAAARAGVTPTSPGVAAAGHAGGLGRNLREAWTASFDTFQVGGETIRNTRIRFADFDLGDSDMLVGADFFLSHRVFVSTSQRKLFFTYNGGPVFRLEPPERTGVDQPLAVAAGQPTGPEGADTPKDAPGFARRAAAFATRFDYPAALADFTRAVELEPGNPQHYLDRAIVRLRTGGLTLGLADLNESLRLKPDNAAALATRAELYLSLKDEGRARADFEAAARLEPDTWLRWGAAYQRQERYDDAIAAYSEWLSKNPKSERIDVALNGRCWARAILSKDLEMALADCNAALKARPGVSSYLDSRGLVRLRMGRTAEAIADYDAALRAQPAAAWTLYARGVAKQRKGDKTGGDADIAAAVKLDATVKDQAKRYRLES